MAVRRSKSSAHYVDNKVFEAAMRVFIEDCRAAKAAGKERPKIPDYIGMCIFNICHGLGKKINFVNYSYVSDMIGDAMENCIRYIDRYNPDHPRANAFSYFTTTAGYAFIRRIDTEKKEAYVKAKSLLMAVINDQAPDAKDSEFFLSDHKRMEEHHIYDVISDFEVKREKKRERAAEAKKLKESQKE